MKIILNKKEYEQVGELMDIARYGLEDISRYFYGSCVHPEKKTPEFEAIFEPTVGDTVDIERFLDRTAEAIRCLKVTWEEFKAKDPTTNTQPTTDESAEDDETDEPPMDPRDPIDEKLLNQQHEFKRWFNDNRFWQLAMKSELTGKINELNARIEKLEKKGVKKRSTKTRSKNSQTT